MPRSRPPINLLIRKLEGSLMARVGASLTLGRVPLRLSNNANKGKKLTPQQLRTKVTQKFNQDRKRYPRRNFGHKAAAAAAQIQNWKGPPERLESEKRKNILELLTLANVATGQVEPDSGHSHLQPPSAFLNSFPAEIRTLPLHRLDLPISA